MPGTNCALFENLKQRGFWKEAPSPYCTLTKSANSVRVYASRGQVGWQRRSTVATRGHSNAILDVEYTRRERKQAYIAKIEMQHTRMRVRTQL